MKPTIKDIAHKLGINISTVSRALRNDVVVKKATRDRVQKTAIEMGYQPNVAARNLARGKTNTIWFLLGTYRDAIEQEPVQVASKLFYKKNYDVLSALHHHDENTLLHLFDKISQGSCDGVIIIPPSSQTVCIDHPLIGSDFPMVTIDREIPGIPQVTTDNVVATRDLIQQCWDKKCRVFIDLFGEDNSTERVRKQTLYEAVSDLGGRIIPIDSLKKESGYYTKLAFIGSSIERVQKYMGTDICKNAHVICAQFDRTYYIHKSIETLTLVQDFTRIAQKATEVLLKKINGQHLRKKCFTVPPLCIKG